MKVRRWLGFFLLGVVLGCGCVGAEANSRFDGTYCVVYVDSDEGAGREYRMYRPVGDGFEGHGCVTVKTDSAGVSHIIVECVSAPPSNRIAEIEFTAIPDEKGVVRKKYRDDGWGNSGKIRLEFGRGVVFVSNEILKQNPEAMWVMCFDKREKLLKVK